MVPMWCSFLYGAGAWGKYGDHGVGFHRSSCAVSLQVARVIEAEIRAGQWTPGNAAPSRNQLAERFGIARETAARAHAWLARAGYLVAVPGVGMVVTPTSRWPG
jgi:DNA-binding GntR family transcriptional regulator